MPTYAKITDETRLAMFEFYQQKQSDNYVATKAQVSRTTVRKYKAMDNWDQRVAAIQKKANDIVDSAAAKRRARWIKQGQALQKVGTTKFFNQDGTINAKAIAGMTAGEAIKAITDGIRMEREAVGEAGETSALKLEIELVDSRQE